MSDVQPAHARAGRRRRGSLLWRPLGSEHNKYMEPRRSARLAQAPASAASAPTAPTAPTERKKSFYNDANNMPVGTHVRLDELKSRPELNGAAGQVCGPPTERADAGKQKYARYPIKLSTCAAARLKHSYSTRCAATLSCPPPTPTLTGVR